MAASPLPWEEAKEILARIGGPDAVLVGGQAVAFWAAYYGLEGAPPVTTDIDMLGDRVEVLRAAGALAGIPHRLYLSDMDDLSPNSGKIAIDVPGGGPTVEIDYLFSLTGLSQDDIDSTAVQSDVGGTGLRVLHPLLCLESKIYNLAAHPGKRGEAGIGQALSSVLSARRFVAGMEESGERRAALSACERVARLSLREAALFAYARYGIDVLEALPTDIFPDGPFMSIRLPQIRAQAAAKRDAYARLVERRAAAGEDMDTLRVRL